MSPSPRLGLLLAAGLLGGCFDLGASSSGSTDTRPRSDASGGDVVPANRCAALSANVSARLRTSDDELLDLLIVAPEVRERHLPRIVELAWPRSPVWVPREVTVGFADGSSRALGAGDEVPASESSSYDARAYAIGPHEPELTTLEASFERGDESPCDVSVALDAEPLPVAAMVTAAVEGADGTLWTGTLRHGLIGHLAGGGVVHYGGVASVDPYDPTWRGPQSGLVLALARQGERGLWLGTATTGVSWLDPGEDAGGREDDAWIHLQPPAPEDADLKELRETVMALAADGDGGLYVGTLDGLWYLRHDGDPAAGEWTRLADGIVLAVAALGDGRVVAGFTTVVTAEGLGESALADSWAQAEAPLLVLDTGGTPGDPGDDDAGWWTPGNADAVLAVQSLVGGAVLGTDRGLYAWRDDAGEDPVVGLTAAVGDELAVTTLDDAGDGVWVGARSACDEDVGLLARVGLDLTEEAPVTAVVPVDLLGLGITPHVSLVRVLGSGDLLVGTLVADTLWGHLTPAACREAMRPQDLTMDTWILPVDGGPAVPL